MNELYSNNLNGTPWVKEWGDAAISEAETRARREVSVDRGWERGGWKEISLLKKFKKKNVFDFIFPWPLFLFIIKLYLTLIKNLHTTPKNCGVCVGGGSGFQLTLSSTHSSAIVCSHFLLLLWNFFLFGKIWFYEKS